MPKGKYEVSDLKKGAAPPPNDASFKLCLCTMLVFIALMLMVVLLVYFVHPLNRHDNPENDKILYNSRNQGEKEVLDENHYTKSTSNIFQKIVEYQTTEHVQPVTSTVEQSATHFFNTVSTEHPTLPTTFIPKTTINVSKPLQGTTTIIALSTDMFGTTTVKPETTINVTKNLQNTTNSITLSTGMFGTTTVKPETTINVTKTLRNTTNSITLSTDMFGTTTVKPKSMMNYTKNIPFTLSFITAITEHSTELPKPFVQSTTSFKEKVTSFSTLSNDEFTSPEGIQVKDVTDNSDNKFESVNETEKEYFVSTTLQTYSDTLQTKFDDTFENAKRYISNPTESSLDEDFSSSTIDPLKEIITTEETTYFTESIGSTLMSDTSSKTTEKTPMIIEIRTEESASPHLTTDTSDELKNSNFQTMESTTSDKFTEIYTSEEHKSSTEPVKPHFERLSYSEFEPVSSSPKDEIEVTFTETISNKKTTKEIDIDINSKKTTSSGNEELIKTSELNTVTESSTKKSINSFWASSSYAPQETVYNTRVDKPSTTLTTNPSLGKSTPLQDSTIAVNTTPVMTTSIFTPYSSAPEICKSESCKVFASRMLSLIDHTQDKCEDFYKFACGGMRKSSLLLEENMADDVSKRIFKVLKSINEKSNMTHQKLKSYYQSCMQYDKSVPLDQRIKQGQEVFHFIGNMVVSGSPPISLTELLLQFFHFDSSPIFDINLDVDSKETTNFTFVLTQPKWISNSFFKNYKDVSSHCRYSADEHISSNLNEVHIVYMMCLKNHSQFFHDLQEAMEAFNVFNITNATVLIQETRMSIEWEILDLFDKFFSMKSDINLDLQTKAFVERSVRDLWNDSLIEWGPLLETLFGFPVSNDTIVQVYFHKYFDELFYKLKNYDLRKLHNALLGIFAYNLYTDLIKTNHPCDREQYCLRVTGQLMPQVMSNIYLQSFSSEQLQQMFEKTSTIFFSLKSTLIEEVRNSTWMDEKSKQAVNKKIQFMKLLLPVFFNDTVLEQQLDEFNMSRTDYLNNSLILGRIYRKKLYSWIKLSPQSQEGIWSHFLNSFDPKVLYIYGTNTLVVPFSISTLLLDSSLPSYIKMAKVGYLLAQGMSRGFERTGVRYNWNGVSEDIIFPASIRSYDENVALSRDIFSYSKSIKEETGIYSFTVNPFQTLNSRLADVTAAKLVLEAAIEFGGIKERLPYADYTPHQTFYIILLQSFCTKKMIPESVPELFENDYLLDFLRINYIAANVEDFGRSFNCSLGSALNLEPRSEPFPLLKEAMGYDYAYSYL